MNFEITSNPLNKISCDGIVVFAFEGKNEFIPTESFLNLDKSLEGLIFQTAKLENYHGREGEILSVHTLNKILSPKIFILGLGKKENFNQNRLRTAIASLAKNIKNVSCLALTKLQNSDANIEIQLQGQALAEGFILGSYNFNKYKKKENGKVLEIIIFSENNKNSEIKLKQGIDEALISSNATIIARDLVNEPASLVTPAFLAKMAQDLSKNNPEIKCRIFEKPELEKMGMNAFLGIAQASDMPPKLIYLSYRPKNASNKKKIAIVGKGITFDTGGVSIKSEGSMKTMKIDMAGAAVVLALFSVISKIKPKFEVIGVIAATPNLISGKAIVPGDIVKASNGKTIEILNTDAEGRVTMADSLNFAAKEGATEIIDFATLTGACEVALGADIAGLFSNNNQLKEKVSKAAFDAGEKLWELPLVPEYRKMNKSEVADIANIPASRYGGAITAALFLEEFIDNKPWVHMDIAGPAYSERGYNLGPKGGTGFGVRLILNYLKNL